MVWQKKLGKFSLRSQQTSITFFLYKWYSRTLMTFFWFQIKWINRQISSLKIKSREVTDNRTSKPTSAKQSEWRSLFGPFRNPGVEVGVSCTNQTKKILIALYKTQEFFFLKLFAYFHYFSSIFYFWLNFISRLLHDVWYIEILNHQQFFHMRSEMESFLHFSVRKQIVKCNKDFFFIWKNYYLISRWNEII